MGTFTQLKRLLGGLATAAALFCAAGASAQQSRSIVIGVDFGGVIDQRANVVNRIRALGQNVQIRGPICLSSCTMYLGAGDVCVTPNVTFGFHGPSSYGRPLHPADFEYWSRVIASHYPAQLSNWFMSTARHRINGYYRVSGAQLIQLGIRQC